MKLAKTLNDYKQCTYLQGDKLIINHKKFTVDTLDELPLDLNPSHTSTKVVGETTYFFSKFSPLSNHFPAPITIGPTTYNSTEQCFFAAKARYLGDKDRLISIMLEQDAGKALMESKKIVNMNNKDWAEVEYVEMKNANRYKYQQNPGARATLLATKLNRLAECSPHNRKWGIGWSLSSEEKLDQHGWGDNWMGDILQELRLELVENPIEPEDRLMITE
jgi:hypothetical protein